MTASIFIKSYEKDFERLEYCLRSIEKFATGFHETILVIPEGQTFNAPNCRVLHVRGETEENGYLFQQCVKLYSYQLSDTENILHIDSDTMFTRAVSPETFMNQGKIWWLYTPYLSIDAPWQPITEKFIGASVAYEYMRRLPLMVPRWLHASLVQTCFANHGIHLWEYVMSQPWRTFSEFNALGALAWMRFRDKFKWINTTLEPMPDTCAIQRWSGDAFDDGIKAKCEEILNGANGNSGHHEPTPEQSFAAKVGAILSDPEIVAEQENGAAATFNATKRIEDNSDILVSLDVTAKTFDLLDKPSKLEANRARAAHARAVMAAKRASGWRPAPRGRKRKKRKARA